MWKSLLTPITFIALIACIDEGKAQHVYTPQVQIIQVQVPYGSPDGGYRGSSGATYQYDLSNPGDRMRYSVDPGAQLRDSINPDPRVELDRELGQYGGGARHY